MNPRGFGRPTWRCVLLMLAAAGQASCALAEDDGWLEFEEAQPAQQNQWVVQPEHFEQWVFQNVGSAKEQRKRFDALLELRIKEIRDSCQLGEAQMRKLRLAGGLDIRRFFDRYEQVKQHYLDSKPGQNDFNEVWQRIQPLQQQAQAGLFGADSMLTKVTKRTFNQAQLAEYKRAEQRRREFRYAALVDFYVMSVDGNIPLEEEERTNLIELILKETKAPNVFGQNDQYYMLFQLSRLDRKEIRRIVPGPRGEALATAFRNGRAYEHHLKSQGVHPYDEEQL